MFVFNMWFLFLTRRRLKPFSLSAWQVNDEISLHLSVEGKVFLAASHPLPARHCAPSLLMRFPSRCFQFCRRLWIIPPSRWLACLPRTSWLSGRCLVSRERCSATSSSPSTCKASLSASERGKFLFRCFEVDKYICVLYSYMLGTELCPAYKEVTATLHWLPLLLCIILLKEKLWFLFFCVLCFLVSCCLM